MTHTWLDRLALVNLSQAYRLDGADVLRGYYAGRAGAAEPGLDMPLACWHGWRNGAVDSGRRRMDEAQRNMAGELVEIMEIEKRAKASRGFNQGEDE